MPERDWAEAQRKIVERDRWIIDGDLGPYDSDLGLRLRAADTVVVLDFPLWRCVWQALRRSRENREFWIWVYRYRRVSMPLITKAIAMHAAHAKVHVLRSRREVERFLRNAS